MKSYKITTYQQALECIEGAVPSPTGTQVLVRITGCGVCHSDLHLWHGYFDLGGGKRTDASRIHALPHTLGHEIAGEVAALGESASGCEVGDAVVVYPWIGCGECEVCTEDTEQYCPHPRNLGVQVDGGYADHVIVPHSRCLYPLGELPMARAATYACSGLTAFSALGKLRDRCTDREVLIIGAGGVGLAALTLARAVLGEVTVVVADIDDRKLETARTLGADHVVNPSEDDARKQVRQVAGGNLRGAVDFVGSPASVGFGIGVLGTNSALVVVGLFGGALELSLPLLPMKGMSLIGSYVGSPADMQALMDLAKAGQVAPLPVETRALDQADQTLRDLEAGRIVGRVVLTP